MDSPEHRPAEKIFGAALELSAEQRAAYLDGACGDDAALRQRVEALLRAHEATQRFLPEHPTIIPPGRIAPGRLIGDYEVLGEIGRGGMGVVYQARQVSLNRVVALKMILAGPLANPALVQRFRTEAEAAARLHHPHIVPIFEIGEHDGEHYFSMKLIEGKTLAQCLAGDLPGIKNQEPAVAGRRSRTNDHASQTWSATLLAKVAGAVHYAHQRGVLHRDLKPTNILIDGEEEPHITDFGLAKLLEDRADSSEDSSILGTPTYMAPEQASGGCKELTTAADIYSLGAILYELLTGQAPFRAATALETLRQVCEQEPVPPRALNLQVDRDLETICLKCLHKNPESRYSSALALAEDLNRSIAGEVIHARPSTSMERAWRWARRKPAIAVLSATAMFLLLAGTIVSTWQAVRATRAKQFALAEAAGNDKVVEFLREILEGIPRSLDGGDTAVIEQLVDRAAARMDKEVPTHHRAEANLRNIIGTIYSELGNHSKAEAMFSEALATEKQMHGPDHPHVVRYAALRAQEFLKQGKFKDAGSALAEGLAVHPTGAGDELIDFEELQSTLAALRMKEGRFAEAETLLRTVFEARQHRLGDRNPYVLTALNNLSAALLNLGKIDEVAALQSKVVDLRRDLKAPEDPALATALHNLGAILNTQGKLAEAAERLQDALALRQKFQGPQHPDTVESLLALGALLAGQDRFEEAEPLLQQALAAQKNLAHDDLALATAMNVLGWVREQQNRLREAEEFTTQALALRTQRLGPKDPEVAQSLYELAIIKRKQGHLQEAAEFQQRALAIRRETLGPEHLHTALSVQSLAVIRRDQRQFTEADRLFTNALAIRTRILGPEHPDVATTLHHYAGSLQDQDRLAEAEPLALQALSVHTKQLGPNHRTTIETLNGFANLLAKQQRLPEAEQRFREVVAGCEKAFGPDHPSVAAAVDRLTGVLCDAGKRHEAELVFGRALPIYRKLLNEGDTNAIVVLNRYAWAILEPNGKAAQAETLLEELLTTAKRVLKDNPPAVADRLDNMGLWFQRQGKLDRAQAMYLDALKLKREQLGPDHIALIVSLESLGILEGLQARPGAAEARFSAAMDIAKKKLAPHDRRVIDLSFNLSRALELQRKFVEAESLLLTLNDTIQHSAPVPSALRREPLERLWQFYIAWAAAMPGTGKVDMAAKWREKLTEFDRASRPASPGLKQE